MKMWRKPLATGVVSMNLIYYLLLLLKVGLKMVFKRRESLSLGKRIREGILPEKGWSRAAEYMMARIKRLPDSPSNIAFGVAIGVFVSFSPFFGIHVYNCILNCQVFEGQYFSINFGYIYGNR